MIRMETIISGGHGKNALVVTAFLSAILALSGCMSSPDAFRPASPVRQGKPVSMDNIYVTVTSSAGDLAPEKILLRDAIISGLDQTGMFTNVTGSPDGLGSGDGIKVAVDIKAIKKVSDNAREWAGALAGRARILVQVTLTDLKSGNLIEVFEVEGQSGASAFAGTTNEAIQNVVQPVVAEALKFNAQLGQ
jgi:hypothetical protein